MAKKRRYDPAMSPTLLALKLQSMIAGRLGVPATDETVKQYLTFISNRYATGYSQYRALTLEVEAILNKNGVDSMLLGLYRSFAFEVYRAVQHGLPVDGIIQKYVARARLDAAILEEIVRAIGERVVKPASQAKAG